jgi:hypothetical protein
MKLLLLLLHAEVGHHLGQIEEGHSHTSFVADLVHGHGLTEVRLAARNCCMFTLGVAPLELGFRNQVGVKLERLEVRNALLEALYLFF